MRGILLIAAASIISAVAGPAQASCQCACVNGSVKALCSSTIEIPPICAPQVCPIAPPAVTPITPPRIPPIGTNECRMEQVLNPATHRYEFQRVCR